MDQSLTDTRIYTKETEECLKEIRKGRHDNLSPKMNNRNHTFNKYILNIFLQINLHAEIVVKIINIK